MSRNASLARLVSVVAVVLGMAGFGLAAVHSAVSASETSPISILSTSHGSNWISAELKAVPASDLPDVLATTPADGARDVDVQSPVIVTFGAPVTVVERWFEIACSQSGIHEGSSNGGNIVFTIIPDIAFAHGESCRVTLIATAITDLGGQSQPLLFDYEWQFTTVAAPQSNVLINEVDTQTPGLDTAEFIELYDGGHGLTKLDGMSLVLYNGQDDLAYASFDLTGLQTDATGYFTLGNESVPGVDLIMADAVLQNGVDAVALYFTHAANIPPGTAVTTEHLLDAVVYGPSTTADEGLLQLLLEGEEQVDENARNLADFHSLQRCPDGSGGQRRTVTFWPDSPTPGRATTCILDAAPQIVNTLPAAGDRFVSRNGPIELTFSEDVNVYGEWFELICNRSGKHTATLNNEATRYTLVPDESFDYGEQCHITVYSSQVSDLDTLDPPDHLSADYSWDFSVIPATHLLINEVDADTEGIDTKEFVELYDGGVGNTPLDGLTIVLYNGAADSTYGAYDLDGRKTDAQGRFVIGNAAVPGAGLIIPDNTIQNGADAVALFAADGTEFPDGTAIRRENLLDAIVYGTADEVDAELLGLLAEGETQVDEDGRGNAANDSNQRCPDGAGEPLHTGAFLANLATPGTSNKCTFDVAPEITGTVPADGESTVSLDTTLMINFSEPVEPQDGWVDLSCATTGTIALNVRHMGSQTLLRAARELPADDLCTVVVRGDRIHDADLDDPPDTMVAGASWTFMTASVPVARHVVINEVDADTAGLDTAEFIELYDGGDGLTVLDGLVLILFNGANDLSYRRLDLSGYRTGEEGYFVVGGKDVPGVNLVIPSGVLQNGPDAVALYEGSAADFPLGMPPSVELLLDALIYHSDDIDDPELALLLHDGEPQLDEGTWRDPAVDSNQRCPNGEGGQRRTSGYMQNQPTPASTNNCLLDRPPTIAELSPANGAQDVPLDSAITVRFDEPVQLQEGWIRLTCSEQPLLDLTVSGGPQQFVVLPATNLAALDTCTATILGNLVHDLDGYRDTLGPNVVWEFVTGRPAYGLCGDEATPIHVLQGQGETSPLLDAVDVVVEGIVSGDFQGADALGGFFLQEETVQQDDNPGTSEGIFVLTEPDEFMVSPGEVIRVQGSVAELNDMTSLVDVSAWLSCGPGSEPEPVPITLPVEQDHDWEGLEAMRVIFPQVLTVVNSDRLGSEGIVELASERLFYATEIVLPGAATQEMAAANQRKRIVLDDGRRLLHPQPAPPYLGPDNTIRLGDTAAAFTGIMSDSLDGYRLQPVQPPDFARTNPRPTTLPGPTVGRTRLATINTGGFYNGDGTGDGFATGKGAQTAEEYLRQRTKLVAAILALNTDIVALTGIENDGDLPRSALRDLLEAVNALAGPGEVYQAISVPGSQTAGFAETVALLYRRERIVATGDPFTLTDYPFDSLSQKPLGQQFMALDSGVSLTVVLAQFPERGNCPQASDPNFDQGDGQACWNRLRSEAAGTLADWVIALEAQTGTEVVLTGDFNSCRLEEPLQILEDAGLASAAAIRNVELGYSAVVNGESASMTYTFVTDGLVEKIALAEAWHVNADEPAALDFRLSNQPALYTAEAFRFAAQDPFIVDVAPAALDAGFTSNGPVFVGEPIQFADATLGPQPLLYSWDFGDGSTVVDQRNPQHLYTRVGTYTVTLAVTTSWGKTAVYSAQVQVLPARAFVPVFAIRALPD